MRRRNAILLTAATGQVTDKYHLGLNDWRVLRDTLAAESAYSIELAEWPDGLWSCTYGLWTTGPMMVDLGNMTFDQWLKRERYLYRPYM